MADVDLDRGQIIAITGLLVAVAIVGLVLVLNTAIYTENLASRGADQSGREAVEYRATVVDGVRGVAEAENGRETRDHERIRGNVSDGIVTIDNVTARNSALRGAATRIDLGSVQIHNGTVIRQPDERGFENASGVGDWTLVSDAEGARSFSMVVKDDASLVSTNESHAEADGAFYLEVDDGSSWRLYVYRNETTGDLAVAVDDGGMDEIWSTGDPEARIDLLEETINGDSRSEVNFTDDVTGAYEISFVNGDDAFGTYNLTVRGDSVDSNDYAAPPDSPDYVAIVYSVDLPLHYESPTVTYRTTVRVRPGELG